MPAEEHFFDQQCTISDVISWLQMVTILGPQSEVVVFPQDCTIIMSTYREFMQFSSILEPMMAEEDFFDQECTITATYETLFNQVSTVSAEVAFLTGQACTIV